MLRTIEIQETSIPAHASDKLFLEGLAVPLQRGPLTRHLVAGLKVLGEGQRQKRRPRIMSANLLRLTSFALLAVWIVPAIAAASPSDESEKKDPCRKVAGMTYVVPSDALACYKSFAFNETIRTNVLDNADRVLDFFTFESYYKNSPAPFQESTVNIRGKLAGFRKAKFAVRLLSFCSSRMCTYMRFRLTTTSTKHCMTLASH